MGAALVVVLAIAIAFAYLAAKAPEAASARRRALSQTDGVPRAIAPESRRRLARGSTAPLASLTPAQMLVGELQTRRRSTPVPIE